MQFYFYFKILVCITKTIISSTIFSALNWQAIVDNTKHNHFLQSI